jgi:hypothetical protein
MDAASFEEGFNAGIKQSKAQWDTIPASQREAKCDEVRQQMEELTQQFAQ